MLDLGQAGAQALLGAGPGSAHLQHGGRPGGRGVGRCLREHSVSAPGVKFPVVGENSQVAAVDAMQTQVATDNGAATLGLETGPERPMSSYLL